MSRPARPVVMATLALGAALPAWGFPPPEALAAVGNTLLVPVVNLVIAALLVAGISVRSWLRPLAPAPRLAVVVALVAAGYLSMLWLSHSVERRTVSELWARHGSDPGQATLWAGWDDVIARSETAPGETFLIDLNVAESFEYHRAAGAINVPYKCFDGDCAPVVRRIARRIAATGADPRAGRIFVYCVTGYNSGLIVQELDRQGFDARVVFAGTRLLESSAYPAAGDLGRALRVYLDSSPPPVALEVATAWVERRQAVPLVLVADPGRDVTDLGLPGSWNAARITASELIGEGASALLREIEQLAPGHRLVVFDLFHHDWPSRASALSHRLSELGRRPLAWVGSEAASAGAASRLRSRLALWLEGLLIKPWVMALLVVLTAVLHAMLFRRGITMAPRPPMAPDHRRQTRWRTAAAAINLAAGLALALAAGASVETAGNAIYRYGAAAMVPIGGWGVPLLAALVWVNLIWPPRRRFSTYATMITRRTGRGERRAGRRRPTACNRIGAALLFFVLLAIVAMLFARISVLILGYVLAVLVAQVLVEAGGLAWWLIRPRREPGPAPRAPETVDKSVLLRDQIATILAHGPPASPAAVLSSRRFEESLPEPTPLSLDVVRRRSGPSGSLDLALRQCGLFFGARPGGSVFTLGTRSYEWRLGDARPGLTALGRLTLRLGAWAFLAGYRDSFHRRLLPRVSQRVDRWRRIVATADSLPVVELARETARALEAIAGESAVAVDQAALSQQFLTEELTRSAQRRGHDAGAVARALSRLEVVGAEAEEGLASAPLELALAGGAARDAPRHQIPEPAPFSQDGEGTDSLPGRLLRLTVAARRAELYRAHARRFYIWELAWASRLAASLGHRLGLGDGGIYFLEIDDIHSIAGPAGSSADQGERWQALAARRRRRRAALKGLRLPPELGLDQLEELRAGGGQESPEVPPVVDSRTVLQGTPVSWGPVREHYRAVDLTTAQRRGVSEEEVLILPVPVPEAVRLMSRCGALVVESGGILSHLATVCRELRRPAVFGVGGAAGGIVAGAGVELLTGGEVRVRRRRSPPSIVESGPSQPEELSVVPLSEARDATLAGAKAATLGQLLRAGLPVPDGGVLTRRAFLAFCDVLGQPPPAVGGHRVAEPPTSRIRFPARARALVHGLFRDLGPELILRSSAVLEDGGSASFAGIFESRGPLTGEAELREAAISIWLGAWSEAVREYAGHLGVAGELAIPLLAQPYLRGAHRGTLFTRLAGEHTSGGEMLVEVSSGDATRGLIVDQRGATVRPIAGGTVEPDVRISDLAALARRIETTLGGPQDIEWLQDDQGIWILQARPITVPLELPLSRLG